MKSKIDYNELIKLIDLMDERDLSQFELEVEGLKIKINRTLSQPISQKISLLPLSTTSSEESPPKEIPAQAEQEAASDSLYYIRSPMVGTFYR